MKIQIILKYDRNYRKIWNQNKIKVSDYNRGHPTIVKHIIVQIGFISAISLLLLTFLKQKLISQQDDLCHYVLSLGICVDHISQPRCQRNIAAPQTETLFLPFVEGGANEPVLGGTIYLGQVDGVKHQIGSPGV